MLSGKRQLRGVVIERIDLFIKVHPFGLWQILQLSLKSFRADVPPSALKRKKDRKSTLMTGFAFEFF